jgi:hypothetical protein
MEELAALLTNYAFPVAISMYLLTRLEKRLGDLEKSISKLENTVDSTLKNAIQNLTSSVDDLSREVRSDRK